MRRRALLAALVLGALVVPGRAQDAAAPRAPLDGLATAERGDWLALGVTIIENGLVTSSTSVLEVTAVASDSVTVKTLPGGATRVFARGAAPLLGEAIGAPRRSKLAVQRVADEKRSVLGRERAARRVDFSSSESDPFEGSAWFAQDAKVTGLVALRLQGARAGASGLTLEVAALGWGTRDGTLAGISKEQALPK